MSDNGTQFIAKDFKEFIRISRMTHVRTSPYYPQSNVGTNHSKETDVSKKSIKSDLVRIDQMKDAEITYSDIPPLGKSFLKRAATAWPPVKKQLTIRLDADFLAWLKTQGRGYQTRINRILRVVMESQPSAPFGEIPCRRLPTRETSKT